MKRELIDLALSAGFSVEAVKKWRQRGHVPAKHRDGLLRAAKRRRLSIQADDCVFTGTARSIKARKIGVIPLRLLSAKVQPRGEAGRATNANTASNHTTERTRAHG